MHQERVEALVVPRRHARVELRAVDDVVAQSRDGGAEDVAVHLADPRPRVLLGDERVAGPLERPVHARVLAHLLRELEPQRRGFSQIVGVENLPPPDAREASLGRVVDEHARHLVVDALEVAVVPRGDQARARGEAAPNREGPADDHVRVELDDPAPVRGVVDAPVEDGAREVVRGVGVVRIDPVVRRREVGRDRVPVRVPLVIARQEAREPTGGARGDPAAVQRDALPVHVRLAVRGEDVVVVVHLAGGVAHRERAGRRARDDRQKRREEDQARAERGRREARRRAGGTHRPPRRRPAARDGKCERRDEGGCVRRFGRSERGRGGPRVNATTAFRPARRSLTRGPAARKHPE